MILNDSITDRQSQPGSFANLLRGEKGIKNLSQMLRSNAGSVIVKQDFNPFLVFTGNTGNDPNRSRDFFSFRFNRISGIGQEFPLELNDSLFSLSNENFVSHKKILNSKMSKNRMTPLPF
jgi:hypothetical protein